jgi:hypothetical protein
MSVVAESWSPRIGVNGPPPGANNVRVKVRDWFECHTLEDLKALEAHMDTDPRMAMLLGRDAINDGLLQGIYRYVPEGQQFAQAESDSWVITNDRKSAWQKLT